MNKNILVVDDDPHIRQVIKFALEKAGKHAFEAKDGKEALEAYAKLKPELIILDINMPEMDGLETCKELRKISDVPILFLSSRDDEIDRIIGLEIGGDDYVTKPFSPRELVARVNTILKRANQPRNNNQPNETLQHGLLALNADKHICSWNTQQVTLTATEFAIMQSFLQRPLKVFDRNEIMNHAYDTNINVSDRTIDSHIRHIRTKFKKLGCESIIETVRGVGYRLEEKE